MSNKPFLFCLFQHVNLGKTNLENTLLNISGFLKMYLACLFIPFNTYSRYLSAKYIYKRHRTIANNDLGKKKAGGEKNRLNLEKNTPHKNRHNWLKWLQEQNWNIIYNLKKSSRDYLLLKGKEKNTA